MTKAAPTDFFTLQELSDYSRLSVRSLRRCLRDDERPLPFSWGRGRIIVSREDYLKWFAGFKDTGAGELSEITARIAKALS